MKNLLLGYYIGKLTCADVPNISFTGVYVYNCDSESQHLIAEVRAV